MQKTMALKTCGYSRDDDDVSQLGKGVVPHLYKAKGCMVLHA